MSGAKPNFALFIAFACAFAGGATLGVAFPLLSLNLEAMGHPPASIAYFTLAAALSTVAATPFVPPLMARLRVRTLLAAALLVNGLCFLGFFLFRDFLSWMLWRGLLGASFTILFVATEAWILERAPAQNRGRLIGLYSATIAGSIALGSALVGLIAFDGPLAWPGGEAAPYVLGGAMALLGALTTLLPAQDALAPSGEAASPRALIQRILAAPAVMLAPLIMGAIETTKYSLLPVYAVRMGMSEQTGAWLISSAGIGVVLLQPLIGLATDRFGHIRVLVACALAGAIAPLCLLMAGGQAGPALAIVFAYAGAVTGLYTVGLYWLAREFKGAELAGANAAYALSYGMGMVIGPAFGGLGFDLGGPQGFMIGLALLAALYLAGLSLAGRRLRVSTP